MSHLLFRVWEDFFYYNASKPNTSNQEKARAKDHQKLKTLLMYYPPIFSLSVAMNFPFSYSELCSIANY